MDCVCDYVPRNLTALKHKSIFSFIQENRSRVCYRRKFGMYREIKYVPVRNDTADELRFWAKFGKTCLWNATTFTIYVKI